MAMALTWRPSRWHLGIEAMGRSGLLYVVMPSQATESSPPVYFASSRASMGDEPRYLGRFPLHDAGLKAARLACQRREDSMRLPRRA